MTRPGASSGGVSSGSVTEMIRLSGRAPGTFRGVDPRGSFLDRNPSRGELNTQLAPGRVAVSRHEAIPGPGWIGANSSLRGDGGLEHGGTLSAARPGTSSRLNSPRGEFPNWHPVALGSPGHPAPERSSRAGIPTPGTAHKISVPGRASRRAGNPRQYSLQFSKFVRCSSRDE
jgi:hypothetical protein